MDVLPVEILQKIFQLVCIDGGLTEYSLSLTSERFRAIVRPIRFGSVAVLCATKRLLAFLSIYEQERQQSPETKFEFSRLYLTIPLITFRFKEPVNTEIPSPSSHNSPSLADNTPTEEPNLDPSSLPLIKTLLSLAAPDLHTLVLQHSATQPGRTPPNSPLLSHPFPCLRSLTLLRLTHHDWLLAAPLRAASTRPPLFPALTRLHINTPAESYSFDPAAWAPDTSSRTCASPQCLRSPRASCASSGPRTGSASRYHCQPQVMATHTRPPSAGAPRRLP
ncbi:hypothetical protein DICSQDRAFT_181350 [Dichomitus squalens LYAD-421 SS1]|uniref:F-box domain-containing protein n=1 Tax=Dichomitus squalens (strain LYAD-421) TaxID=732165 RepID=R7SWU4_DICSQ|nr:uncharacterized protein DICSQDRAFT_181350 [Dichomitus squalens LYAD-421 SS1]EJF60438.1 hypothetical protein DICSQDRAFT_181350 [Dichomitus squalens LYAD-421 SS1]